MKYEGQTKGVASEVHERWDAKFSSDVEVVGAEEIGNESGDVGELIKSGAERGEGVSKDEVDDHTRRGVRREERRVNWWEESVGDSGRYGGEEGGLSGGGWRGGWEE